jgi:hypothetical protein
MSDHDALNKRGRALEEDYFRKKDLELIEKIRQAGAEARVRTDMGRKLGLDAPELIQELHDLGFTPDTVVLLPLVPIIQVAWAEGGITKAERELILRLARSRGIEEGSAADRQLADWLTSHPHEAVFAGARRLIRAVLDAGAEPSSDFSAGDLVKYCEDIAAASGGILGIGRVSAEERELLSSIAADLKTRSS